jgi:hypothetical protein
LFAFSVCVVYTPKNTVRAVSNDEDFPQTAAEVVQKEILAQRAGLLQYGGWL